MAVGGLVFRATPVLEPKHVFYLRIPCKVIKIQVGQGYNYDHLLEKTNMI